MTAALAIPAFARSKAGKRLPQVGLVVLNIPIEQYRSGQRGGWAIIKPELRRLGWTEGQNIVFHLRSAEGDWSRIPAMIREMVSLPVDVLVTYGDGLEEAIKQTKTIPIVTQLASDRRHRPPANLTGTNGIPSHRLQTKQLSLLKAISPSISRVAIVHDQRYPDIGKFVVEQDGPAAAALGMTLVPTPLRSLSHPEPDLDAALDSGIQGVLVFPTLGTHLPEAQLPVHAWARRRKIPVMYSNPGAARTGGLIAFGSAEDASHRRSAYFIDKLLRGAKPSDLPIEDPVHFELVINLGAAKAIGLSVPVALQIEATHLIP